MTKKSTIKKNERRKRRPAKSIPISFRITPFMLGRALDGLMSYDNNFEARKLSQIVSEAFKHGVNALTINLDPGIVSDYSKEILVNLSTRIELVNDDFKTVSKPKETGNGKTKDLSKQQKENTLKQMMIERGYQKKTKEQKVEMTPIELAREKEYEEFEKAKREQEIKNTFENLKELDIETKQNTQRQNHSKHSKVSNNHGSISKKDSLTPDGMAEVIKDFLKDHNS